MRRGRLWQGHIHILQLGVCQKRCCWIEVEQKRLPGGETGLVLVGSFGRLIQSQGKPKQCKYQRFNWCLFRDWYQNK